MRWELEADLRHAELIIEQLGLTSANAVSTPGVSSMTSEMVNDDDEDDDDNDLLNSSGAAALRAITARCNYLQGSLQAHGKTHQEGLGNAEANRPILKRKANIDLAIRLASRAGSD